jgi:uncharacterized membrane protein
MMDLSNKLILITSLLLVSLSSCYYDNEEDLYPSRFVCDTTKTISFARDVTPVLKQNCWTCHSSSTASALGSNIILETPTDITSRSSKLLKAIKHESGVPSMPKNSTKMTDCEILIIENWINQGGNDN